MNAKEKKEFTAILNRGSQTTVMSFKGYNLCNALIQMAGKIAVELRDTEFDSISITPVESCPYCKRTEPCVGVYPEGCFLENKQQTK